MKRKTFILSQCERLQPSTVQPHHTGPVLRQLQDASMRQSRLLHWWACHQRHRDLLTDCTSYWEIPPPPSSTRDRAFKTWASSGDAQHPNHRPSLRSNRFSLTVHFFPNWWTRYKESPHLPLHRQYSWFHNPHRRLGSWSLLLFKMFSIKVSKMLTTKSDSQSSMKGSHDRRKNWLLCRLTFSWGPRHSYPHTSKKETSK